MAAIPESDVRVRAAALLAIAESAADPLPWIKAASALLVEAAALPVGDPRRAVLAEAALAVLGPSSVAGTTSPNLIRDFGT